MERSRRRMREEDYRRHLTRWVMFAGSLALSNDIRDITAAIETLLLNSDVTAIAQDPLCIEGRKVHEIGDIDIWTRPLSGGATAVALFNREVRKRAVRVKWSQIGLARQQDVRDLWRRVSLGKFNETYPVTVPA